MQKQLYFMVNSDRTTYPLLICFSISAIVSGLLLYWDGIYAPSSQVSHSGPIIAKIASTESNAMLKRLGQLSWDPAYKDSVLYRKDKVYTGSNSKASVFFPSSGVDLELAENSLIEIDVNSDNTVSALITGFATFKVKKGSNGTLKINDKIINVKGQEKDGSFTFNAKTGAISKVEGATISVKNVKTKKISQLDQEVQALAPEKTKMPSPELVGDPAGSYTLDYPSTKVQQYFKSDHLKKAQITFPSGKKVVFNNFRNVLNFEPAEIGRFNVLVTEQEGEFGVSDSLSYQMITTKPDRPTAPVLEYEVISQDNKEGRFPLSENLNRFILIKWSESPRTERYELEIASDTSFQDVIFAKKFDKSERSFKLPYSETRDIYVRIKAIDGWEQQSDWSQILYIPMVSSLADVTHDEINIQEPEPKPEVVKVAEVFPKAPPPPPVVRSKRSSPPRPQQGASSSTNLKQLAPQQTGDYYIRSSLAISPSSHTQTFEDETIDANSNGLILNSYAFTYSMSPYNKNYYYNFTGKFAHTEIKQNFNYTNLTIYGHMQFKLSDQEFYMGPGVALVTHSNYAVSDNEEVSSGYLFTALPSAKIEKAFELEDYTRVEVYGLFSYLSSYIMDIGVFYFPDLTLFDMDVIFGASQTIGNLKIEKSEIEYSQTSIHAGLRLPF